MARLQQDTFRIFISHKHADKELADLVARELEALAPGTIDCWVSGQDLTAGADWDRQIKTNLGASHLLILLFTTPAHIWDWCLFEVGLFIRFEVDEVSSVVCLLDPKGAPPGPLGHVQGVHAERDALVTRFLRPLCTEPWKVTDDWQRGPLNPMAAEDTLEAVATRIADAFQAALARGGVTGETYTYHPCHRIVLDLRDSADTDATVGIPLDARVIEGPEGTTSYTLSLFHIHEGRGARTWGELVERATAGGTEWQHDLDKAFADSLRQELWEPSKATVELTHPGTEEVHRYMPVLYEVERRHGDGAPVRATITLVPT